MKRNREERLKSSGTHHIFISPHNREESGERRLLTLLILFYSCIEILYLILELLKI